MTCPEISATAGLLVLLASSAVGQTSDVTVESLMKRLDGVAPAEVLANATLLNPTDSGDMQVLREGTNGWTCMYPGTNPMCADEASMSFLQSWMKNEDPPDTLGFVYMLLGDEGASNIDPHAEAETPDNQWVVTGPHVMLLGSGAKPLLDSYPTEVPEGAGQPWVMWPGTPYAHLMMPMP
ncbi:hypothetical protein [Salipiger mangrovisoli]|uniref:Uncharacterized protein n=1 Tax=Salipiger mangrovisoli TaxID=2865933 RepID=A0ABR9X0D2_9RHOB|nr:hypothetical protein [Salipiger mangrovisoli]MBE9637000.1 hypothetical protein [Salipiger mangrovisoli]